MKYLVVLACLAVAAHAAPSPHLVAAYAAPAFDAVAARRALPPVDHQEIHDNFGQYALRYVTAEGTVVSERGRLVPSPDGQGHVLVIEGETTFIGTDGKTYTTKYTSGLDGFHAEGAHLPKAPEPMPVPLPVVA